MVAGQPDKAQIEALGKPNQIGYVDDLHIWFMTLKIGVKVLRLWSYCMPKCILKLANHVFHPLKICFQLRLKNRIQKETIFCPWNFQNIFFLNLNREPQPTLVVSYNIPFCVLKHHLKFFSSIYYVDIMLQKQPHGPQLCILPWEILKYIFLQLNQVKRTRVRLYANMHPKNNPYHFQALKIQL